MPGEASRQVLMDHLEQCEECARFLESQRALSAEMDHLAAEGIPAAEEFAGPVMAEFDLTHPPRRPARMPMWRWALAAGLAAAVGLVAISLHRPAQVKPDVPPVTATTIEPPRLSIPMKTAASTKKVISRPTAPETEQPFFPIPYTVPLGPGEWARVERMQIPVAALIAAGFHMPMLDPAATVEADVLVSQEIGRAHV